MTSKNLWSIRLNRKLDKNYKSQKFITIFLFEKNWLVVCTLGFKIRSNVNFSKKKCRTPRSLILYIVIYLNIKLQFVRLNSTSTKPNILKLLFRSEFVCWESLHCVSSCDVAFVLVWKSALNFSTNTANIYYQTKTTLWNKCPQSRTDKFYKLMQIQLV